jgi:hypothetical protein
MTEDNPGTASPSNPDPFDGPDWQDPGLTLGRSTTSVSTSGDPKRRRIRVNRRKRRRIRRIGWALIVGGGVIVLAGVWLVVTGLVARGALTQARADVHRLRAEISSGDLVAARGTAVDFAKHAQRAHQMTTGPAWALAAALPGGGEPLKTIRGVTASIDRLGADALPQLVRASDGIDPAKLRDAAGNLDLARIAATAPALDQAAATMSDAASGLDALPNTTWLHSIDTARRDVIAQLAGLRNQVRSADVAAHAAPVMLGQSGVKRYFVAFQNDAEARGTGGLPGAFAIVQADHGKLQFVRFESDAALAGVAANVEYGRAYDQLYNGANTTSDYRNSNLSPNFPYAAQTWVSMWQKLTGEHLDGAVALDPTALSYLLKVTGPATMPDKSTVTSSNVVALTQSAVYVRFATDNQARRLYLLAVARAVGQQLIDSHVNVSSLVKAAGTAAGQRRLLVWSADPSIESLITQTSVSGAIPVTSAPYVGLSIVNDGGNKLDYYLDRRIVWQRLGCGSTREVWVTISLTNNAPAQGLSPYVTARSDVRGYPTMPGDNRLEVSYLATTGAAMSSVTLDGKPTVAGIGSEHDHPLYTVDVELPRGTTRTVVLHLVEPGNTAAPIVLRQPLVRPLQVSVNDAACG